MSMGPPRLGEPACETVKPLKGVCCVAICILIFCCTAIYFIWRTRKRRGHEHSGGQFGRERNPMINNFEHFQKLGKENAEATVASFGAVSKGFQKIAVELADY